MSRRASLTRVATAVLAAILLSRPGPGGDGLVQPPAPPADPRVVIVSIDGLRPDALAQADAPNILGLARRGAWARKAETVFPSLTLAAHASMVSGLEPTAHGLTWNDYRPERGAIRVPTVFSLAHAAGLRTVMVVGKEKLAHLDAPGSVDTFVLAMRGDKDVANEAVVQAGTGFDLMLVHLPQTDLAGHAQGWMSPAYLLQVAQTDGAVARILAALPLRTTVILTSDHGGEGRTHGSAAAADMTIPWIIAGPNVCRGRALTTRVRTTDTAATAAYVLGLELPAGAVGRPVLEAFCSELQPVSYGKTRRRLTIEALDLLTMFVTSGNYRTP